MTFDFSIFQLWMSVEQERIPYPTSKCSVLLCVPLFFLPSSLTAFRFFIHSFLPFFFLVSYHPSLCPFLSSHILPSLSPSFLLASFPPFLTRVLSSIHPSIHPKYI
ncbi:hypothetical protein ILYODFUR_012512 [Ilyodon furcidens]|uniref:Uncharacterized protein n=1 Tax=Ilyodon furcidens TaxID=33524 RepID=A0ABV0V2I3_9TELE